jgi:hypothetical protein
LVGGNVLVCEAASGRVLEVTERGEVVWELVVPQPTNFCADPIKGVKNPNPPVEKSLYSHLTTPSLETAVKWRLAAPVVSQQHCAHEINEAGDILILDNGVFRPPAESNETLLMSGQCSRV